MFGLLKIFKPKEKEFDFTEHEKWQQETIKTLLKNNYELMAEYEKLLKGGSKL